MKTRLLSAACVLLAAGLAGAEAGNLTSVACDPEEAFYYSLIYSRSTSNPRANSGVVDERATEFAFEMRRRRIRVAIDSSERGRDRPDIARIDFSGRGRYHDAPTVPLTERGAGLQIGPADVEAEVDGRTLNIRVEGNYTRRGNFRRMGLRLGTGLEGEVAFGDQTRRVRLVDGVGNLRFGDAPVRMGRGRVNIENAGDSVAVFKPGSDDAETRAYFGQPVRVADQWYELKLSNDMTSLSAEPVEIETGKVELPLDEWTAVLWGRRHVVYAESSEDGGPMEVPADTYVVFGYSPGLRIEGHRRPAVLRRRDASGPEQGWSQPVVVRPGSTVSAEVGPPLVGTPTVREANRQVRISLSLTDAAGVRIADVRKPNGRRPDPPRLEIVAANGRVVHSGVMGYG